MGTSKDILIDRIHELEKQLETAKKNTYIYETQHLQCSDGEMHIGFGDDRWLVWNTDSLYKDLPFIINQVVKENKKQQKMYLDMLKKEINEL
tara:strand:+ start:5557 stop:5832 length:276 start_codon:yes stop_codon:yes gene_type:complete